MNLVEKISLFLIMLLLGGCTDVRNELYRLAENSCAQKSVCVIDLKGNVLEENSELYIFNNPTKEYVQEKIGVEYNLYEDFGDKIFLIKNGKIIFYYELFPNSENIDKDVLFSFDYEGEYFPFYKITYSDSTLRARKLLLTDKHGREIIKYEFSPVSKRQISY